MPKKNSFFFFMLKRKAELTSEGIYFPRGLVDVAQHVNAEWTEMSPEEKSIYKQMADDHNAVLAEYKISAAEVTRTPSPEHSFEKFVVQIEAVSREQGWEEECMREIREMVKITIKNADLAKIPLLILNFSIYNGTPREELLLAEVGLSVFTIGDGVIENFSALIDPGPEIPKNLLDSVTQSAVKLALPFPGYNPESQDYGAVLDRIFHIGKLYASYYDRVVTFHCLQKDWILTEICIKWLMFRADIYTRGLETEYNFNVIPLDIMMAAMSSQNISNKYKSQSSQPFKVAAQNRVQNLANFQLESISKTALAEMKFETERFCPILPTSFPKDCAEDGYFTTASQVSEFLDMDNYAYHEELACAYHSVRQDGVYFCPLNLANRYAFNLLHVLVAPFKIPPRPGSHYPTLRTNAKAEEELQRRMNMVHKWELCSPVGLAMSERAKDKELVEARRNDVQSEEDGVEMGQEGQRPKEHSQGYIDIDWKFEEQPLQPIWEELLEH